MILQRIFYGLLLIGALLFQMFSDLYLAAFILAVVVLIPWLSLLLSLPAMLGCRVRVWPKQPQLRVGQPGMWIVAVDNRSKLPVSKITIRLHASNLMFGTGKQHRLRLSGASRERRLAFPADTSQCGMLSCCVQSVKVCDCLGIFALRRKPDVTAQFPVYPKETACPDIQEEVEQPPSNRLRPRLGGGPGEDYDLREYRPGDPVRLIHWKLSSKRDAPVIREVLEAEKPVPTLCFDHVGLPDDVENVIGQLERLCLHFLERSQPVAVTWLHPLTGEKRMYRISSQRELRTCMEAVLSDPAPESGHQISTVPKAAGTYVLVPLRRTTP